MTQTKRYCPSCGRLANANNNHPTDCPECGGQILLTKDENLVKALDSQPKQSDTTNLQQNL